MDTPNFTRCWFINTNAHMLNAWCAGLFLLHAWEGRQKSPNCFNEVPSGGRTGNAISEGSAILKFIIAQRSQRMGGPAAQTFRITLHLLSQTVEKC